MDKVDEELKTKNIRRWFKSNFLTLATLCGVILGIALGAILRVAKETPWTARESMYVSFVGDLFLSALKSIIIPLVIPSLIIAIGSLDVSLSGKIGKRAVCYYLLTTIIAIIIGIVLVLTIRPGDGVPTEGKENMAKRNITTADTLMDLLRNMVPANIIQSATQQVRTELIYPTNPHDTIHQQDDLTTWNFRRVYISNSNILGLIAWSIVFGVGIAVVGDTARPVLRFFAAFTEVMMKVTNWVILFAPVGVMFLITGQVVRMKDPQKTFEGLSAYFGTVVAGLLLHSLIILPLIYGIVTRSLPFRYISNMGNPLLTAFGTASSSATLPVTLETIETKNNVDPRVSRFVLPIGATINMDGTALYEAVAAIFIAQVRGISLSVGQVIAVSITATAASIGAAGIPQAGLVTMVMVLNTVNLPSTDIALILSVDWLLDRFRTAVNVLGDGIGAGIVNHLSRKELEEMDVSDSDASKSELNSKVLSADLQSDGVNNEAFDQVRNA